jgi:phage terminase large subunit GpA-like protein
MKDILDAVTDPRIRRVVYMKPTQVGWTDAVLLNFIGYQIDHDPGPGLLIMPTEEAAKKLSRRRLAFMIRDTACLRGKVTESSKRDGTNNLLQKIYPGGSLTLVGANSTTGLASDPIRFLLGDEIDRYPPSAGDEGDPLDLAFNRTRTYWNRKELLGSTPDNEETSRIKPAYLEGDRRTCWLPCTRCGEFQLLEWGGTDKAHGLKWDFDDPRTARYVCRFCQFELGEKEKHDMLRRYEWRAERETIDIASFWNNQLYSPFTRWAECVDEFLKAKGKKDRLRVWVNTVLAETWVEKIEGDELQADMLQARAQDSAYLYGEIPDGVRYLLCSVDTQNDRLETSVIGFGAGEESWRIDRHVILGDPAAAPGNDPNGGDDKMNVWQRLDEILAVKYVRTDGSEIGIDSAIVDTGGGKTDAVYNYCATRHPVPVYAAKGSSDREAQYVPVDKQGKVKRSTYRSKSGRRGYLYLIGVHKGKDLLYSTMTQEDPGPGYFNVPKDLAPEYVKQLAAEVRQTIERYGHPYHVWHLPPGRRNEAIDLENYARALLRIRRLRLDEAPKPKPEPTEGGQPTTPTTMPAPRSAPRPKWWQR